MLFRPQTTHRCLLNECCNRLFKMAPVRHSPFCPVKALVDYCRLRASQPGPLFCHQNIASVTVNQFNSELSRCLKFCGLVGIKATVSELAPRLMRLIGVFPMPKFALLVAGNLTPSNFIFVLNALVPLN